MHGVRWVVIARQSIPLSRIWWQSTADGVNVTPLRHGHTVPHLRKPRHGGQQAAVELPRGYQIR